MPAAHPSGTELLKNETMYSLQANDLASDLVVDSLLTFFIFAAILLLAFLFFRFLPKFFPQENKNILRQTHAILWGIALLAALPLLSKAGVHFGYDMAFHLIRIDAIFEGLKSGQFPVRMSGIFNLNHGLPVNVFYGDWLLYFPALLRFLDMPLSVVYQIYGVLIHFLSVYLAWFAFSRILQNRTLALFGVAALMTAHYRLFSFYARAGVGEFTAMAFLPLVLLGFWRIYGVGESARQTQFYSEKTAIILALGLSGLITSHVITTVITLLTLFLVALFFYKKTFCLFTLKTFALGAVLTLFLTAAFWVPFLDYYANTWTELKALATLYQSFIQTMAVSWNKLLMPFGWQHWMLADFVGLVVLILACFLMLQGRANKNIQFFVGLTLFLMWLCTNTFPWDFVSNLPWMGWLVQIQFPWRFLSLVVVTLALLAGLLLKECPEKYRVFAYSISAFLIFFNALLQFGEYVAYTSFPNANEKNFERVVQNAWELPNFTGLDASNQNYNSDAQYQIFETDLEKLSRDVQLHNATLEFVKEKGLSLLLAARTESGGGGMITVPRLFYPYYHAASESGALPLEWGENNLINIVLPPNFNGKILLYFSPPWFWRVAEVLTILSFLLLVFAIFKIKQKSTVNL